MRAREERATGTRRQADSPLEYLYLFIHQTYRVFYFTVYSHKPAYIYSKRRTMKISNRMYGFAH